MREKIEHHEESQAFQINKAHFHIRIKNGGIRRKPRSRDFIRWQSRTCVFFSGKQMSELKCRIAAKTTLSTDAARLFATAIPSVVGDLRGQF